MDSDQQKKIIAHCVHETLWDLKRVNTIIAEESEAGQNSIDAKKSHGMTPLMLASICGDFSAVQRMVKKNADVDVVNRDGNSAIMLAAWNGFYDILRFLEKAGADVNIVNKKGQDITTLILESHFEMDGVVSKSGKLKGLPHADAHDSGHISMKLVRQMSVEGLKRATGKDGVFMEPPPHC